MSQSRRIPPSRLRWDLLLSAARSTVVPAAFLGLLFQSEASTVPLPAPSLEWGRFSVLTPAGPAHPDPERVRRIESLVWADHRLEKGEGNAYKLAKDYGTTIQSLQATNNDELILLSPGRKLKVLNKKGTLYTVSKDRETLDAVVARYRREPSKARELKEWVVRENDLPGTALLGSYELSKGDVLLMPEMTLEFDTYRFPFKEAGWARISSGFGNRKHPILKYKRFHAGLDLPKPYGTPVYPARSGRVVQAGWREGYGNMVEVKHQDGASTVYGHLSSVDAKEGDWVVRGKSLLGKVGSTGLSTGPHLHFEVRDRSGHPVNPRAKIGRK